MTHIAIIKMNNNMNDIQLAIVIVAYNRTESVRRLFNSLLEAHYPQTAPLIISIDKSDTEAVGELADKLDWPYGDKKVIKHQENLGLRRHVLSIGEYTKLYDGVIVLEDDLEVSPSFYNFALEAVRKYRNDERIAGISLYSFTLNLNNKLPFIPEQNGFDAFLFQNAQSWGQVWMTKAWMSFIEWYSNHSEEFPYLNHLPYSICHWGKNSWLKYHIKYCIEKDKYFVYPYISMTFCSGAVGTHSSEKSSFVQNAILRGCRQGFRFPDFEESVKYDGFFERVGIKESLGLKDVCVDINGEKGNRMGNRYWLTTKRMRYRIIRSFGLLYIPIERNVLQQVYGNSIFLYDTSQKGKLPSNNFIEIISLYKYSGLFSFMRRCGFIESTLQILRYLFHRLNLFIKASSK